MINDFMFFHDISGMVYSLGAFLESFQRNSNPECELVHPQCIFNVRRYIKKTCMDQLIFALGQ